MRTNTKRTTFLNFFAYYDEEEKAFVGGCVDLGIVKVNEDLEELKKELVDASLAYVKTIIEHNLSEDLLNQDLPEDYMKLYDGLLDSFKKQRTTINRFKGRQEGFEEKAELFRRPVALVG